MSTALKFTAKWSLPQDFSIGVQPGVVYQRNDTGD
jgi:hypothetical protein